MNDATITQTNQNESPDFSFSMSDNKDMALAWQFIADTGLSVFLTGKAGTGKTTFLRNLKKEAPKRMVILAPTGVAAINAGGQTIHSFFQFPFGPYVPGAPREKNSFFKLPEWKKDLIRTLDLIVIDEISMVRADMLDQIDNSLRTLRNPALPFGGVQLLLIGDLMQLSPVAKQEEWSILAPFYQTPYFFSSHALARLPYVTIELKKIYRQQDEKFINLLGKVRNGLLDSNDLALLNSRYDPKFVGPTDEPDWIRLTTHNATAQDYNQRCLYALKAKEFSYNAIIQGDFPEYLYPMDEKLVLKVGTQVMFIKNDNTTHAYYNGKIGVVTNLSNNEIEVTCGQESPIKVTQQTWENIKYTLNESSKEIEEKTAGSFTHYPLRLAWAITVHKSQGLTFDHAVLDVNSSFAHGQTYVALSRCRTLEGMRLSAPINTGAIMMDPSVNNYIDLELDKSKEGINRLDEMKSQYVVSLLDEMYSFDLLFNAHERLSRVAAEYVGNNVPLYKALKELRIRMSEELRDVAFKFRNVYAAFPLADDATKEKIQERIKGSCTYFCDKIADIFTPFFHKFRSIGVENRKGAEMYAESMDTFYINARVKSLIFSGMMNGDFTSKRYLSVKAKALLDNTGKVSKAMKNASRQKVKKLENTNLEYKKKPKHKGATVDETYELKKQGLTIKEIAAKRNLAVSTIYTHMGDLLQRKLISIDEIVAPERIECIREAMKTFTESYSLTELKEKLPEDYEFPEVRLTLFYFNSLESEKEETTS